MLGSCLQIKKLEYLFVLKKSHISDKKFAKTIVNIAIVFSGTIFKYPFNIPVTCA